MDTIFICLNRQMQLERLFAYQELAEKDLPKIGDDTEANKKEKERFAGQVCEGMRNGGVLFKKIYQEDFVVSPDTIPSKETRERLTFWSKRFLSHNLLWQVMRNQNETELEVMRQNEQELEQYKARRATLEKNRHTEEVSLSKLDDQTAKTAYYSLLQSTLLQFVTDSLSKTMREKIKNSSVDQQTLTRMAEDTQKMLQGRNGWLDAFRKNGYYWLAAGTIAGLAILLPLLWNWLMQTQVNQAVGFMVAMISSAAPIIPTIQERWRKIADYEADTRKAFENAYEAQLNRHAEDIASANIPFAEKIRHLEDEVKKGSLPACDVLIRIKEQQIEQQRRKIGPAARYSNLLEFVQSRLDAATYENQLGLMHQVRQDIDELTYSLVSSANSDIFPRGKPRVLLYIDDLDRCPPQRVVEILEAVQLLLNTKLFVVILGLDTRYVTRALEKEYKEILQHEGDPSGLDYIEKIIQIPYRVRPIERDGCTIIWRCRWMSRSRRAGSSGRSTATGTTGPARLHCSSVISPKPDRYPVCS